MITMIDPALVDGVETSYQGTVDLTAVVKEGQEVRAGLGNGPEVGMPPDFGIIAKEGTQTSTECRLVMAEALANAQKVMPPRLRIATRGDVRR